MPFKNPAGLYALLALIPFIFLYLRRPKPKEKTIPSLMFFIKEGGVTKFANFFKQILRNLLFLLQLAIILSAAFAIASPFFTSEKAAAAKHTVLVIDGSASMNALLSDGSGTRFGRAVEEASSRLEGRVSVVLAENIPVVALDKGTATEARKILSTLKAKATKTHIGDGMLAAGELIDDSSGNSRVVVLSDFQADEGTDAIVAKRSLAARKIDVELVNVLGSGSEGKEALKGLSNVGFVGLDINKFQTTALVRNYDDSQHKVDLEVMNNGNLVAKEQLDIGPRSVEPFSFGTVHGSTQLDILRKDDLETDNRLFVSSPVRKIRALLITNSDSSYLMAALRSSPNVELDIAFPPVVKAFNYDVIIIHNASSQFMLPGFYREINKAVMNGTGLVVTAQQVRQDLPVYVKQFDMPLELFGMGNSSRASVRIEGYLTKGVDFGVVAGYNVARPYSTDKFTSLVVADDNSSLLGSYSKGSGIVFYYGLLDDASTFKSSYFYPVFWDNLLSFLTRSEDIASFNVQTGRVEGISEQQVMTPSGRVKTARLFFDEAGFYTIGSKVIAANIVDKAESDIASEKALELASYDSTLLSAATTAKSEIEFGSQLAFAALALVLLELLLVKMRGDL
ncbi:BatA domain-containing protein [Candidatus Woesearchaeota archaeon]|nr:BatA domain-containing protein [Candidatus Woesearchaeota archaeon]MBI2550160.1 BatA domain-containing protein [Candidatus Woesearchaeota archaeon]